MYTQLVTGMVGGVPQDPTCRRCATGWDTVAIPQDTWTWRDYPNILYILNGTKGSHAQEKDFDGKPRHEWSE